MTQSSNPDSIQLLEELQRAIREAEKEAVARETQFPLPADMPPANAHATRQTNPSVTRPTQPFDRVCHLADRLTASAETELTDIEAALKNWLSAAESWRDRLDSLLHRLDQPS